jgi:hypothetical protein
MCLYVCHIYMYVMYIYVCVCVCVRERERESTCVCMCACMSVCIDYNNQSLFQYTHVLKMIDQAGPVETPGADAIKLFTTVSYEFSH